MLGNILVFINLIINTFHFSNLNIFHQIIEEMLEIPVVIRQPVNSTPIQRVFFISGETPKNKFSSARRR